MDKLGRKKNKKNRKKTILAKGIYDQYSSMETKENFKNTLVKSITEIATGAGLGSVSASALGKSSPLVGALMVLTGNYLGDKSGLLKTLGVGTIAYGIAKSSEEVKGVPERFQQLKQDWLCALRLSKAKKKPSDTHEDDKINDPNTLAAVQKNILNNSPLDELIQQSHEQAHEASDNLNAAPSFETNSREEHTEEFKDQSSYDNDLWDFLLEEDFPPLM